MENTQTSVSVSARSIKTLNSYVASLISQGMTIDSVIYSEKQFRGMVVYHPRIATSEVTISNTVPTVVQNTVSVSGSVSVNNFPEQSTTP